MPDDLQPARPVHGQLSSNHLRKSTRPLKLESLGGQFVEGLAPENARQPAGELEMRVNKKDIFLKLPETPLSNKQYLEYQLDLERQRMSPHGSNDYPPTLGSNFLSDQLLSPRTQ